MARDPLARYREMRDFDATPEPSGRRGRRRRTPVFVIQQHAASSMHFDFRIEAGGALASWAVPKGPSTDPRDKRLAMRVEDHPVSYGDFEGTIPAGNYGAGAVIVWDAGPYRNLADVPVEQGIEDGRLKIWLEGQKLRGGYALTRTGGGRRERWLLVKMRDEMADARRNPVSTEPRSVLSGRTVAQVARGP
jgi:DNA ligase D-like protein (predicted 3'-phosphoesterase)